MKERIIHNLIDDYLRKRRLTSRPHADQWLLERAIYIKENVLFKQHRALDDCINFILNNDSPNDPTLINDAIYYEWADRVDDLCNKSFQLDYLKLLMLSFDTLLFYQKGLKRFHFVLSLIAKNHPHYEMQERTYQEKLVHFKTYYSKLIQDIDAALEWPLLNSHINLPKQLRQWLLEEMDKPESERAARSDYQQWRKKLFNEMIQDLPTSILPTWKKYYLYFKYFI